MNKISKCRGANIYLITLKEFLRHATNKITQSNQHNNSKANLINKDLETRKKKCKRQERNRILPVDAVTAKVAGLPDWAG